MSVRRSSVLRAVAGLAVVSALAAAGWVAYRRLAARPPTPPGWQAWVVTVAGDGSPGAVDGSVTTARFSDPFGIAIGEDGIVYIADAGDSNRIRSMTRDGIVATIAGDREGFADGRGRAARFHTPSALAIDRRGYLYVADTGNHAVRKIAPDGLVTTLAGTGLAGYRDGPGSVAQFDGPVGVAVDGRGNVLVADTYNDRIRRIGTDGLVTTIAGGGTFGFADGRQKDARFDTPVAVAVSPSGDVLVADAGNDAVRRIAPDGTVSTIVALPGSVDRHRALVRPMGLAVTHDGVLYVSARGQIVEVSPSGSSRSLAGAGPGWADGEGASARFNSPAGLAVDRKGGVYVAEPGSYLIRHLRVNVQPIAIATAEAPELPAREMPAPRPRLNPETLGIDTLPWPLDPQDGPHELVGTLGEPRGNAGGDGRDRFHTGIDVSGVEGTLVRAVHSEKVRSPIAAAWFDAPSESLSAGIFTYMHLRVGRTRQGLPLDPARFPIVTGERVDIPRVRVRRGTRIAGGEAIGTINRFQHVQIDLGPSGAELNPLSIGIVSLADRVEPLIERDGVRLESLAGVRLTERQRGRLVVREPVSIVVQAYDRVDGNGAQRKLGLYRLGYQILRADLRPVDGFSVPQTTIEFDRLPTDPSTARLAFAAGSGITVYGNPVTRMSYIVTNTVRHGRASAGMWDAPRLPPGDYVVRVMGADYAGNVARRDLAVTVAAADSR